jgi:hypothetical protein
MVIKKTPITINTSAEINATSPRLYRRSMCGTAGKINDGRCSKFLKGLMTNSSLPPGAVVKKWSPLNLMRTIRRSFRDGEESSNGWLRKVVHGAMLNPAAFYISLHKV